MVEEPLSPFTAGFTPPEDPDVLNGERVGPMGCSLAFLAPAGFLLAGFPFPHPVPLLGFGGASES